jgi:hypothetical protein
MAPSAGERHVDAEHPGPPEQPRLRERRIGERRQENRPPAVERRAGAGSRSFDRRSGVEMRGSETVEEHVRNALQLLVSIVETGALDDDVRRDIDAAAFRLRFAVERLRRNKP